MKEKGKRKRKALSKTKEGDFHASASLTHDGVLNQFYTNTFKPTNHKIGKRKTKR